MQQGRRELPGFVKADCRLIDPKLVVSDARSAPGIAEHESRQTGESTACAPPRQRPARSRLPHIRAISPRLSVSHAWANSCDGSVLDTAYHTPRRGTSSESDTAYKTLEQSTLTDLGDVRAQDTAVLDVFGERERHQEVFDIGTDRLLHLGCHERTPRLSKSANLPSQRPLRSEKRWVTQDIGQARKNQRTRESENPENRELENQKDQRRYLACVANDLAEVGVVWHLQPDHARVRFACRDPGPPHARSHRDVA